MKILLIAPPRTGSTNLLNSLSEVLDLSKISIRHNFEYPRDEKLIDHIASKKNKIVRIIPSVNIDLFELIKKFDSTILLSRKDDEDHYKSFVNLFYKEFIQRDLTSVMNGYTYDELPTYYKENLKYSSNWMQILKDKEFLLEISKKIKSDIVYYEDLYYSDIGLNILKKGIPILDIDKMKILLDNSNRYRKEGNKTLI